LLIFSRSSSAGPRNKDDHLHEPLTARPSSGRR
jgi:hypothetical protein